MAVGEFGGGCGSLELALSPRERLLCSNIEIWSNAMSLGLGHCCFGMDMMFFGEGLGLTEGAFWLSDTTGGEDGVDGHVNVGETVGREDDGLARWGFAAGERVAEGPMAGERATNAVEWLTGLCDGEEEEVQGYDSTLWASLIFTASA